MSDKVFIANGKAAQIWREPLNNWVEQIQKIITQSPYNLQYMSELSHCSVLSTSFFMANRIAIPEMLSRKHAEENKYLKGRTDLYLVKGNSGGEWIEAKLKPTKHIYRTVQSRVFSRLREISAYDSEKNRGDSAGHPHENYTMIQFHPIYINNRGADANPIGRAERNSIAEGIVENIRSLVPDYIGFYACAFVDDSKYRRKNDDGSSPLGCALIGLRQ